MYNVKESSKDEEELVWNGIIEYNSSKLPLKSEIPFAPINRVMSDTNGEVIGGINCELNYYWNTLYIDMLWIKDKYRKNGYGSKLLNEVEIIAKEQGCYLVHLETMDMKCLVNWIMFH